MAPEVHAHRKATAASDVFSLHVVMWEVRECSTAELISYSYAVYSFRFFVGCCWVHSDCGCSHRGCLVLFFYNRVHLCRCFFHRLVVNNCCLLLCLQHGWTVGDLNHFPSMEL